MPLMLAVGIVLALGVRHEMYCTLGKASACISFRANHAELYSLRALSGDAIFDGTNLTNRA